MEIFSVQIAILLVLGLLLVMIGVWTSANGLARLSMVGIFVLFIGLIFTSSSNLLGRPKPVALEWLAPKVKEATVLSGHMVENEGIYLTLLWADSNPRLYVLPWDQQTAEQLQQALREGEQNGTEVKIKQPFEPSEDDSEPLFYASPQQKPADKPQPEQGLRLGHRFGEDHLQAANSLGIARQ